MKTFATLLLTGAASVVNANVVFDGQVQSQATMNTSTAGKVNGCGMRFIVGGATHLSGITLIDASLSIYADGSALAKAGLFNTDSNGKEQAKPIEFSSYWLKTAKLEALPLGQFIKSESKGYALSKTDLSKVGRFFSDLASSERPRLVIGFKTPDGMNDLILSGDPNIDLETKRKVADCLQALVPSGSK